MKKSPPLPSKRYSYQLNYFSFNLLAIGFGILFFANNLFSQQQLQLQLNPQVKQGGYHISCSSLSDGVIQALAIGGTPPYSYSWSDGATQANRSGLSAGTYILTVTDSLLSQVTDSVKLFQPQLLSATSQKK